MSLSIGSDFENFVKKLKLSEENEKLKSSRYHSILKIINKHYYSLDDDSRHGLYVGSHGRGTDIYTSDIDIVVILPWSVYSRFNSRLGNKQSDLLQEVKNVIKQTYSNTDIKGDGQVIVIRFSDGMVFEVVPAFEFDDNSFCYANSNNGGSWQHMDPRNEIKEFNLMDKECNYNLKNFCKMLREWNKKNNVFLEGIVIDTMAYRFLSNYKYRKEKYFYYDWFSRDFFKFLIDSDNKSWNIPGGHWRVTPKYSYAKKAEKSYDDCIDAIGYADKGYEYSYKMKWHEIYGSKF